MQFQLKQSLLRPYLLTDQKSILEDGLIQNANVARYMSELPHPYLEKHADEWLERATSELSGHQFAITLNDRVIGGMGFMLNDPGRRGVQRHSAEFGYWLGEPYWGRGITTEAAAFLTNWGFEALGLVRIEAAVFHPNAASVRVLEKCGFQFEGRKEAAYFKHGQYYDGLMFAKVRLPHPSGASPAT